MEKVILPLLVCLSIFATTVATLLSMRRTWKGERTPYRFFMEHRFSDPKLQSFIAKKPADWLMKTERALELLAIVSIAWALRAMWDTRTAKSIISICIVMFVSPGALVSIIQAGEALIFQCLLPEETINFDQPILARLKQRLEFNLKYHSVVAAAQLLALAYLFQYV